MGYRSEVVLVVGKEVMPQFMVTMAKSAQARSMCWAEDEAERVMDYDEEGSVLFRWDHIKWYESYPAVAKIQSFVECPSDYGPDTVEGTDPEEFFRFVRAGEESSDNEEHGGGFEIYISRTIEYEY